MKKQNKTFLYVSENEGDYYHQLYLKNKGQMQIYVVLTVVGRNLNKLADTANVFCFAGSDSIHISMEG